MSKTKTNIYEIQKIDLPSSWVRIQTGDVCFTTSGGTPSRKINKYYKGVIPWAKSGELNDGLVSDIEEYITDEAIANSSAKVFPSGTLLIALYGATVGKLGILTKDAATNQAVCAIFPPEGVNRKYLFWYLRYIRSDLIASAIGGAQPNISQGIIKNTVVPIAPINEQKHIVAEIEKQFSRLDEAVDNLKRVKANLKRYKASVLKAAVEGKLTEEWRAKNKDVEPADKLLERILVKRRKKWEEAELVKMRAKGKKPKDDKWKKKYKEPAKPNLDDLPALPDGWIWVTYEQLGEWTGGGTPSKRRPEYWEKGSIPWVSPKDMKIDKITKTIDKITLKAVKESVAKLIPSNSLLFVVRSGILRRILPIALTEVDVTVNQDLKALTPLSFLNASYLFFSAQAYSDDILHTCQKDGTTVESIEVPALQIFPTPLPPLSEQEIISQEISRRLTVVDNIYNETEKYIKRADRLRQSILKKAFSGRLVPQNSSDKS